MDLKEIAALIQSKNYVFQVSIPGTGFSHGKTTVQMALADSPSLESYLEKIGTTNRAQHLFIKLFAPNGSSFKPKGEHLIFLAPTQPVAPPATTETFVAKSATNVADQQQGVGNASPAPQKNTTMDVKDYIDYKVLQNKHELLQGVHDETKAKVKQLEKKIDELQDENKAMLRESSVKDEKHSIALDRAKLEMEREGKEGLSGLVGELTKDPDTLKMIVGFLKPDHPMFKEQAEGKTLEGAEVKEIKYVEDSAANQLLNDIPRMLSQKDGKTMGEIYLLFQEFVNKPEVLAGAVSAYLPQLNENS